MSSIASLLVPSLTVNAPALVAVCAIAASPPQLSLAATTTAGLTLVLLSVSCGSGITPLTSNGASPGPIARIRTVRAVEPPITKPAVSVAPALICLSTDTLISRGVLAMKEAAADQRVGAQANQRR